MRTSGERPILFSGEMVRALLAGTKTQTRRIIKCPPSTGAFALIGMADGSWWPVKSIDGESLDDGNGCETFMTCPFGKPGDRLWVRESFCAYGYWTQRWNTKKAKQEWCFVDLTLGVGLSYHFDFASVTGKFRAMGAAWHRRPSLFMPRVASRLTLEVTEVRVQRLQEISEDDALAEGIERCGSAFWRDYLEPAKSEYPHVAVSPRTSYSTLWELINGVGSWDENPWVWAVSFKVVDSGL